MSASRPVWRSSVRLASASCDFALSSACSAAIRSVCACTTSGLSISNSGSPRFTSSPIFGDQPRHAAGERRQHHGAGVLVEGDLPDRELLHAEFGGLHRHDVELMHLVGADLHAVGALLVGFAPRSIGGDFRCAGARHRDSASETGRSRRAGARRINAVSRVVPAEMASLQRVPRAICGSTSRRRAPGYSATVSARRAACGLHARERGLQIGLLRVEQHRARHLALLDLAARPDRCCGWRLPRRRPRP